MSRTECSVPLRNFLGTPHGIDVARSCGRMRIAWIFGACTVISLGLLYSYFVTKKQQEDYLANPSGKQPTVVVPLWLCALPLLYALFAYTSAITDAENFWKSEEINFNTSDMNKKDYLTYRIAEDRQKSTTALSLTNTALIASVALFGAFLRGDPR